MQVGDLVTIRPSVQPPHLYGIGLVVKVDGPTAQPDGPSTRADRVYVRWPTMPDRELKSCARYALELVSRALPRGEGT